MALVRSALAEEEGRAGAAARGSGAATHCPRFRRGCGRGRGRADLFGRCGHCRQHCVAAARADTNREDSISTRLQKFRMSSGAGRVAEGSTSGGP